MWRWASIKNRSLTMRVAYGSPQELRSVLWFGIGGSDNPLAFTEVHSARAFLWSLAAIKIAPHSFPDANKLRFGLHNDA